jgi:hypothetical protein
VRLGGKRLARKGGVRREYESQEIGRQSRKDDDAESEDDGMNLFKRHIGRRAAGVGVGVALLMLGLEAPAFAAAPTVTTVLPTSGPPGCVVVVTGTNFNNPNVTSVKFGTIAATFTIQSGTELWTTVPAAAPLGATTITIDNGSPPAAVIAFTRTDPAVSPGGCAPTVTSYTPSCGSAGTSVVIAGTNLLRSDDGTGGVVKFAPYAGVFPAGGATHSNAATETPTSLTVFVPTGAADGPIRVSTFNDTIGSGAALGATVFNVPPPDCVAAAPHPRSISLKLKDKLVAKGTVKSTEATPFTECAASVPVKIQRKVSGSWKTVGKTTTSDTGAYSKKIKNKKGKYRSLAVKITLASGDVCGKAKSPVRTH